MNKFLIILALFSISFIHVTVAQAQVDLDDPLAAVDPSTLQDNAGNDDDDQDQAGVDDNGIWIGGITPTQVDLAAGTDDDIDSEIDNAEPDSDDQDNALADSDNGQYDGVVVDQDADAVTSSGSSIPNVAAGANMSPAKTSYSDPTWISVCLQYHNIERAKVGVPALKWSSTLAKQSYAWSKNMASTKKFVHSRTAHTGENIAETTSSTDTLYRLFRVWIKEKDVFKVGCTFPNCQKTSAEVGHYTAMVWRTTTQVGCGWAKGPSFNYFTCQYLPSGNRLNEKVY